MTVWFHSGFMVFWAYLVLLLLSALISHDIQNDWLSVINWNFSSLPDPMANIYYTMICSKTVGWIDACKISCSGDIRNNFKWQCSNCLGWLYKITKHFRDRSWEVLKVRGMERKSNDRSFLKRHEIEQIIRRTTKATTKGWRSTLET